MKLSTDWIYRRLTELIMFTTYAYIHLAEYSYFMLPVEASWRVLNISILLGKVSSETFDNVSET